MSVPKALDSSLYSDRLILIVLLVSVTIASWLFVINGGGMGMPALKMTSLDLAYGGSICHLRWLVGQQDMLLLCILCGG